jgi:hypothetical protein
VVLGIGFSYWGNRPTKTPIPLLTDAGASTVAIITYHVWIAVYFDTEMALVFFFQFDVEHC